LDFEVGGTMKLEDEEEEEEVGEENGGSDITNTGTTEKVKFHLPCVLGSNLVSMLHFTKY
jgi:hypothetical protein